MKLKDRLNKEELERLYWEEGMTQGEIGEKFGVSASSIWLLMNGYKMQVLKNGHRSDQLSTLLTKKFLKQERDNGKSANKIAKENNCDHVTVLNYLKRHNLCTKPINRYEYNEIFFDKWTPLNAWMVGFIMADGYFFQQKYLGIALSTKDTNILETFRKNICPKNKVRFYKTNDGTGKYHNTCKWACCNKYICNRLQQIGFALTEKKTAKEFIPESLPDNLFSHFLRGYFDGDGCVCLEKKTDNKPYIQVFCANFYFLKKCRTKLNNIGMITTDNSDSRKIPLHNWRINKIDEVRFFRDFIYKDIEKSYFLKRKKGIFDIGRYILKVEQDWNKGKVEERYLKLLNQLGYAPTKQDIEKYDSHLVASMYRYGYTLESLALKFKYKPNRQSWTKEKVIIRVQELTNKLGHYPKQRELGYALQNAVIRYGGGLKHLKQFITIN